jgi:hypothetical protein
MKIHARAVTRADEAVLGVGRAVHEVPRLHLPLFALDHRQALAREHEEILLVRLAVVPPTRLAGLEDGDRVAEVRERRLVALEDAGRAEHLVVNARRLAHVDDEPAVGDGVRPGSRCSSRASSTMGEA